MGTVIFSPEENSSSDIPPIDRRLSNLVEELTDRLITSTATEIECWIDSQGEHAESLRTFLPSLKQLTKLNTLILSLPRSGVDEFDTTPWIGKRLGDFIIIRELGRGGMGMVFEAEQLSLPRRVALKILAPSPWMEGLRIDRFRNEAATIARLNHPHIVDIYSVGFDEATHFFAMRLVEGGSSAEFHLSELSFAQRCELVAQWGLQAASALAHAHDAGIIHRDIKPSNLLVDRNAKLWVTDFGVARFIHDEKLTKTDNIVGTLRYMSPEQALPDGTPLDHRSDLYSLGAVLFELISTVPLLSGDSPAAILQQLACDKRPRLRDLAPGVALDLETIINKAIALDASDRYASATDLSADLTAFLEGRPIKARPPTIWRRLELWRKRNEVLARTLSIATMVFVMGTAVAWSLVQVERDKRLHQQNLRAEQQRTLDLQKQVAEQNQYAGSIQLAYQAWLNMHPDHMLSHLSSCVSQGGSADWRSFEWYYLKDLMHSIPPPIGHHEGEAYWIEFSSDGQTMLTFGEDGCREWNVNDWTLLRHFPERATFYWEQADWEKAQSDSPIELDDNDAHVRLADGSYIVGNHLGEIAQVNHQTKGTALLYTHEQRIASLALSPDQRLLAAGDGDGSITYFRLETMKVVPLRTIRQSDNALESLFFHSRITAENDSVMRYRLASSSRDGVAVLSTVDLDSQSIREMSRQSFRHDYPLWCARVDAKGESLITCDRSGAVRRWDLKQRNPQEPIVVDDEQFAEASGAEMRNIAATSVRFDITRDEQVAATIDRQGALILWILGDRNTKHEFSAAALRNIYSQFPDAPIEFVKLSPDGKQIAMTLEMQTYLFQLRIGTQSPPELFAPKSIDDAGSILWSPDQRFLMCVDSQSELRAVDLLQSVPDRHVTSALSSLAFTPDGSKLITCSYDGRFSVWDARTLELQMQFAGPKHSKLAISPDGRTLATTAEQEIILWNLASLRELLRIPLPPAKFHRHLAFSRDGRALTCSIFIAPHTWGQFIWVPRDLSESAGKVAPN